MVEPSIKPGSIEERLATLERRMVAMREFFVAAIILLVVGLLGAAIPAVRFTLFFLVAAFLIGGGMCAFIGFVMWLLSRAGSGADRPVE